MSSKSCLNHHGQKDENQTPWWLFYMKLLVPNLKILITWFDSGNNRILSEVLIGKTKMGVITKTNKLIHKYSMFKYLNIKRNA